MVQFGVSVPAPDIGMGWTMIVQQRAFSAGRKQSIYRYYYTPKHQIRLRSKPEVERFQSALQALHENDDDEDNENDESDGDDEYDEMLAYEKAFGKKAHCGSKKEERVVVAEHQKKKNDSTVTNTVTNTVTHTVKRNDPPPRRPPSSYVAYLNSHREQAKLEHPTTPKGDISKLLTTRWHKLSDQQQQEFKIKSGNQQEFDNYNRQVKEWKAKNGKHSLPKSTKNNRNNNNNNNNNNNKQQQTTQCWYIYMVYIR